MENQEKFLLNENADQSTAFIASLEEKFIPAVDSLVKLIKKLGIEPTQQMISGAIAGDFTLINDEYSKLKSSLVDALNTPEKKASKSKQMDKDFENFPIHTRALFAGTVGNIKAPECPINHIKTDPLHDFGQLMGAEGRWGQISKNSPSLLGFISIDESGKASIPDQQKENIRDLFREYVEDPKKILVRKTQQEAAAAIQNFVNALEAVDVETGFLLSPLWVFGSYFKVNRNENGTFVVSTKKIEL